MAPWGRVREGDGGGGVAVHVPGTERVFVRAGDGVSVLLPVREVVPCPERVGEGAGRRDRDAEPESDREWVGSGDRDRVRDAVQVWLRVRATLAVSCPAHR